MRRALPWMAVVLLGLLGWFAFTLVTPHDEGSVTAPADAPASPADRPAAPLARGSSEPAPDGTRSEVLAAAPTPEVQKSSEPVATTALVGRVTVAGDGTGVPGVDVRVVVDARDVGRYETRTDDDGRYRFDFERGDHVVLVEVGASPTTTAVRLGPDLVIPDGVVETLDVEVTTGASVSGTVVDENGAPVAGATVLGWCSGRWQEGREADRTITAGDDGSFTVPHLGDDFVVRAEAPGLTCDLGLRGKLAPGERVAGLELLMRPSTELRGLVLGAGDRPLAGAHLDFYDDTQSWESETRVPGVWRHRAVRFEETTGDDGRFVLAPVVPRSHRGYVRHDAYLHTFVTLEPGEETVIRLDPGLRLAGRVVSATGAPVEGARVRIRSRGDEGLATRGTTTDALGRFDAQALVECPNAIVSVRAEGHAVHVEEGVRIAPGAPEVVIELGTALSIAGRVLDEAGRPVPFARVSIQGDRIVDYRDVRFTDVTTWEWQCGLGQVTADAQGRFRIDDLYDGEFAVRAAAPDDKRRTMEVRTRSGDEDLVIRFDPVAMDGVVLEGRVTDALTGRPVEAFAVTPMVSDPNGGATGRRHEVADPEGAFRLAGYEPGTFCLIFKARGYAPSQSDPRELEDGRHRFDAALYAERTAEIVLRTNSGAPLSARARLYTEDDAPVWVVGDQSTSTDLPLRDGRAFAQGLPARVLTMRVTERSTREVFERVLDLREPPTAAFEFVLDVAPMRNVALLLLENTGTTAQELRALFEASGPAALARPGVELVATRATVRFRDANAVQLAKATLERKDGEFLLSFERPGHGSHGNMPFPVVTGRLPATAVDAVVEAEGYEALVVPLERDAPDDPQLVLLKRR